MAILSAAEQHASCSWKRPYPQREWCVCAQPQPPSRYASEQDGQLSLAAVRKGDERPG